MELLTKAYGNDITARVIPCEKFTSNYLSFQFAVPLKKETVAKYALLSSVMQRGCVAYPTQEAISMRLEELYGADLALTNAQTGEIQILSFAIDMLDDRFSLDGESITDGAIALLREVLVAPYLENGAFSAEYVEREKANLIDNIRAAINNKNSYALKRCREIMCAGEAYSLSLQGTEDEVAAITPQELYAAYEQLLREAKIMVFYLGKTKAETVLDAVSQVTASFTDRAPLALDTEVILQASEVKRVVESVNAVQGKLTMGFRLGTSNRMRSAAEIMLMNAIFGSSTVSKLFMNVREKLSLCYYCSSMVDSFKGVLYVYSGVENENAEKAEKEILLQLAEMQAGHITDEEFACAKQHMRGYYRSIADSPVAMGNWYKNRAFIGDSRSPEDEMALLETITVEQIVEMSKGITLDTVYFLRGVSAGEEEV